jgi:hypothetical protein
VAVDLAPAMLLVERDERPPGTAGDAVALPFRERSFDIVLAPFSLNHLADPTIGVREAGRVGSLLVASTYAADDDHPARAAVDATLSELGWERPAWYSDLKTAMAGWGTVEDATSAIERGGLRPLRVERQEIAYNELGPLEMVAWRMGMAQAAPFVAELDVATRARAIKRAIELLGPNPEPIVRRVIFLAAASSPT